MLKCSGARFFPLMISVCLFCNYCMQLYIREMQIGSYRSLFISLPNKKVSFVIHVI